MVLLLVMVLLLLAAAAAPGAVVLTVLGLLLGPATMLTAPAGPLVLLAAAPPRSVLAVAVADPLVLVAVAALAAGPDSVTTLALAEADAPSAGLLPQGPLETTSTP
jgi:hypothetical protein